MFISLIILCVNLSLNYPPTWLQRSPASLMPHRRVGASYVHVGDEVNGNSVRMIGRMHNARPRPERRWQLRECKRPKRHPSNSQPLLGGRSSSRGWFESRRPLVRASGLRCNTTYLSDRKPAQPKTNDKFKDVYRGHERPYHNGNEQETLSRAYRQPPAPRHMMSYCCW